MKKFLVVLLVIVLVAVIGLESYVLFFRDRTGGGQVQNVPAGEQVISQSPVMTVPPIPTDPPATPEPTMAPPTVPPATPEPTQAPATPAPTPEPTPTPPPSDGSFTSNTGTNLNLTVSWRTEDQGNGTSRVYVTGKVTSYSLQVMGTKVNITLGGYSTTANGSAIMLGSDVGRTESDLFSATLDVPTGTSGTLSVDWAYKGTYSGVSLPNINASGEITA